LSAEVNKEAVVVAAAQAVLSQIYLTQVQKPNLNKAEHWKPFFLH